MLCKFVKISVCYAVWRYLNFDVSWSFLDTEVRPCSSKVYGICAYFPKAFADLFGKLTQFKLDE
jgi:hypothetical protein